MLADPATFVAGSGLVGLGVARLLPADHIEDGPVICPFRLITGLPCPGCGLTRSWVYATHGDWAAALGANPFGVVLIGMVALSLGVLLRRRLRAGAPGESDSRLDWNQIVKRPWSVVILLAWSCFAVVRMILVAAG